MILKDKFDVLPDGREVVAYTLKNASGAYVKILNYGGILNEICVPDREGKLADVICGYDTISGYLTAGGYQGALIGRYGNRIGQAKFTLEGKEYVLYKNDGDNHLHGGKEGFDKKIWEATAWEIGDTSYLALTYLSPDGEEGYPGALSVKVVYSFTANNTLTIDYHAATDKTTVLNLTNHAYFNMAGYNGGCIEDQLLYVNADSITEVGAGLIPTGACVAVKGTPFDFRKEKTIGQDINAKEEALELGMGYDHNFVLNNGVGAVIHAATLTDPVSGRSMEVYTDQPCMQIYTANAIEESDAPFKGNVPQKKRCAVCFETQHAPDAVNHPEFASAVLHPGEIYHYTTIFAFSAK
ncbi:MAG: galactose mutarotase [Clostridia bacterium]|nr:galactose mutarotase [Clostridia bacterium]